MLSSDPNLPFSFSLPRLNMSDVDPKQLLQQAIEDHLQELPVPQICFGTIPHLPSIDIVQDAKGESLNKPVTLRFPLSAKRCKQLMALGAKTPFGKGPEKLQDDQVRLGWQLEPQ